MQFRSRYGIAARNQLARGAFGGVGLGKLLAFESVETMCGSKKAESLGGGVADHNSCGESANLDNIGV